MISFVNFARVASICVGFHLGALHGYFFHKDFWPNLNFLLEYHIKLVLTLSGPGGGQRPGWPNSQLPIRNLLSYDAQTW